MTYCVRILADSIAQGARLITLEATFPRFILAEFNTHRDFSRNSASSRAIPVERRIEQVRRDPFVPGSFSRNQKGMQGGAALLEDEARLVTESWLRAMEVCANEADYQRSLGVHKQYANRLIELWGWHTVVVTATQWKNFFALRTHRAAQPEMQILAKMMKAAIDASEPRQLEVGHWHLPYITASQPVEWIEIYRSVVCCAAISYERQLSERTAEQVTARHDEMVKSGHWSPFEHQAKVANPQEIYQHALFRCVAPTAAQLGRDFVPVRIGNLAVPWLQYRKTFKNEAEWQGDGT